MGQGRPNCIRPQEFSRVGRWLPIPTRTSLLRRGGPRFFREENEETEKSASLPPLRIERVR
jgi:hypothetical protein